MRKKYKLQLIKQIKFKIQVIWKRLAFFIKAYYNMDTYYIVSNLNQMLFAIVFVKYKCKDKLMLLVTLLVTNECVDVQNIKT